MTTTLIIGGAAPATTGYVHDICARALAQLRARGSRIVLTDTAENLAAGPELVRLADEVGELDFTDADACVAWARARAEREPIEAVLAFREYAVVAAAEVAAALGLPGNPPEAVRRVRTKDVCREYLRERGFRQPALRLCASAAEAEEFHRSVGGTVIVKPRSGSSSEGVQQVDDPAGIAAAFAQARDEDGHALVETFVSGPEFSVEGIITSGSPQVLAVTGKQVVGTSFVECGHTMPAPIAPEDTDAITEEVANALRALGLRHGLFHVECWLTDQGVVLGELHVRQGGDWIHAMVEWTRPGLELYGSWLDDLLGRPVQLPAAARGAATRFLTPPPGTVDSVRGWAELAARPEVLAASCELAPGTEIRPIASNLERYGVVVVGTAEPEAAGPLADKLLAELDIRLR
ncbi:biotin carboxylase [Kitasatospora gansuensis]|uniref:Biotin carboxylase n=1 Tax=Kitasatospora gansuensis TaxID=258050 RepID=A0A7W7SC15_9ACTN|nr:ATP-grasp domain-containing protein [Kitasatospora gansuensis]MBB4947721.1 biotin carboxylase [Kitasatospora gansuensis]